MDTRVIVLSIKSLERQIKSVSLPRNASVLELKAKIQIQFDVEETRQRLIFQGKVLKDDKHLSDYGRNDKKLSLFRCSIIDLSFCVCR